ncbi:TniB family NTP-binding protein [uncultured Roseobacter sp.]|uniref:TniB family NTP-binding protein n=1 Tax=uncultured Roseobacter sp. TaxID=114847 RepID=UPI002639D6BC|nr:TniB family NTP-binding protein [uncultured Roseobacter sp.]
MMNDVHLHMARLRAKFIRHRAYVEFQEQFDILLHRRRAAMAVGASFEAEGIVLTGASGSGKTTAVDQAVTKHPDLVQPRVGQEVAEIIRLQVPSPATLKTVGSTMSEALGYELVRDKSAALIWQHVRKLLHARQTLFVHFDEAQDIYLSKGAHGRNEVVNTLKSLMNNKDWPVGLILSGTPDLLDIINLDRQLQRRVRLIHLDAVSWLSHRGDVTDFVMKFAAASGLSLAVDLKDDMFSKRLIHAGGNQFGLIIDMILCGIETCLLDDGNMLTVAHFADAFRRKTACLPALNPFLAEDFLRIDVGRVCGGAMTP